MIKKIDLIGQRFGRLKVVEYLGVLSRKSNPNKTDTWWKCICDCGNIRNVVTSGLTKKNTKSCGCYSKEISRQNALKIVHEKLPYGESEFNGLYRIYAKMAKQRNFEWELSKIEVKELFKKNCYYCNKPPSNKAKHRNTNGEFIYNGIDRLNNNTGYLITNCVSCCAICNWMKREQTPEDFLLQIRQIYIKWFKIIKD